MDLRAPHPLDFFDNPAFIVRKLSIAALHDR
jgi:hypothetical protein